MTHFPSMQDALALEANCEQLVPQLPQFAVSVNRSTQTPSHVVCDVEQVPPFAASLLPSAPPSVEAPPSSLAPICPPQPIANMHAKTEAGIESWTRCSLTIVR